VVDGETRKIHESVFMGRGIYGQYLYINPANNMQINASSIFHKAISIPSIVQGVWKGTSHMSTLINSLFFVETQSQM
jgi:hypothetical protein